MPEKRGMHDTQFRELLSRLYVLFFIETETRRVYFRRRHWQSGWVVGSSWVAVISIGLHAAHDHDHRPHRSADQWISAKRSLAGNARRAVRAG
ncbi:MAG: hypothetical protein ACRDVP_11050 [Acidimicrobiales bacterium]